MTRRCELCGRSYDDAVSWTFCPHERFISKDAARRKDVACSLLGKDITWQHLDGPIMRVESIEMDGMVTVTGYTGSFAPDLFRLVVSG